MGGLDDVDKSVSFFLPRTVEKVYYQPCSFKIISEVGKKNRK